jgi:hypothetical protein
MKSITKSLRCPPSSTSRPCRWSATVAAPPWVSLTLLVADGKSPNDQEDHIRPEDEEGITIDKAPWRSKDAPSQNKSLRTAPLPQTSRHHHQDGAEAGKTLSKKTPPPPPERRPTKPLKPGEQFIHVLQQCLTPSRVTSASMSSVVWLSLVLVDCWADVG